MSDGTSPNLILGKDYEIIVSSESFGDVYLIDEENKSHFFPETGEDVSIQNNFTVKE